MVVDEVGAVMAEARRPTPAGGAAVLDAVVAMVDQLGREVPGVAAAGVGLPGLVDRSGVLRFAPNLPGVVELDVAGPLAERTCLPIRVDNDATCALAAEHRTGAAAGCDDVVLVTLGTGIGGGLLLDGRLVRGRSGFAGEIGHMVVVAGGIACPCGREGCWERYASGSALAAQGGVAQGEEVTAAAAKGDAGALAVLDGFAGWFALGLANLVHVLDVGRVVVGGGVVEAGDVVLEPIRRAFGERLVAPEHRPPVAIVPAALGERAGAVGAALLAL